MFLRLAHPEPVRTALIRLKPACWPDSGLVDKLTQPRPHMPSFRELLCTHFCWTRQSGSGDLGVSSGCAGPPHWSNCDICGGAVKNISLAMGLSCPIASECKSHTGKETFSALSCFLSYFQYWFTSCSLFTVPLKSMLCPARTFSWEISLPRVPEPDACTGRGYTVMFICYRVAGLVALVCSCLPAHSCQG